MLPQKHTPIAYIAPLDGIRALAIIGVYIFHVFPDVMKGGFVGVDVFYVLSGFLITSIIINDLRSDRFSLSEFYLRRIQRLLPNVIVTVLVTLLAWHFVMMPSQVAQMARHSLWTLFNASNFFTWLHLGDYWSDAAEWAPLTHTWSLGIEEQFYLLFPSILLLLFKYQRGNILRWLCATTVLSVVACIVFTRLNPTAAFYLLPTRVWELLLGAILAVRHSQSSAIPRPSAPNPAVFPRLWNFLGIVGLILLAVSFFAIDSGRGFPGYISLAPTLGTVCLILSATEANTAVAKTLSWPLLVQIGKRSYSLYLWHWPAIIFAKYLAKSHGFPAYQGALAGGIAGIGLAWLAYKTIEQPLRKRDAYRSWRLSIIAVSFVSTFCLAFTFSIPSHSSSPFAPTQFFGKLYDSDLRDGGSPNTVVRYADVVFPNMPPRTDALWKSGGIVHPHGGGNPRIVVLGSSHALMYSRLIDDLCREHSISVAFLGFGGRSVFFDDIPPENAPSKGTPDPFDSARRDFIKRWRPHTIIAIDRWDARFEKPLGFEGRLRAFLGELSPLAQSVVFVAQVPALEIGEKENLREAVIRRMKSSNAGILPAIAVDPGEPLRHQSVDIATALQSEFPCLKVLRTDRLFYKRDGSVRYAEGRTFYYADDDHLSDAGSNETRDLFDEIIRNCR